MFVKPKYLSVHRKITIYWKTTLSLAIAALMVLEIICTLLQEKSPLNVTLQEKLQTNFSILLITYCEMNCV